MTKTSIVTLGIALALAAAAAGCGGKKKDAGKGSAAPAAPVGSDPDVDNEPGGSNGSGMGGSAALVVPASGADLAKKFEDCWALWSAARFDAFGNCYALDAVSEAPGSGEPAAASRAAIVAQAKGERGAIADQAGALQLVMVSGQTVVSIALITGTFGGKATGAYAGVVTDFDGKSDISHEQTYLDAKTIQGQASGAADVRAPIAKATGHEIVIAKDDDREKGNLAAVQKLVDAYNKHDAAAFAAPLAETVVWSEAASAKDVDKKGLLDAITKHQWHDMPDVKLELAKSWTAGDYVAQQGTLSGTRAGKPFSAPVLAIYKLADGKIATAWSFYQSSALPAAGSGSGSGSGSGATK